MSSGGRWRTRVVALRREARALALAARDPRTPRLARWLVARQGIVLRVSGALLIVAALAEPVRSLLEG